MTHINSDPKDLGLRGPDGSEQTLPSVEGETEAQRELGPRHAPAS